MPTPPIWRLLLIIWPCHTWFGWIWMSLCPWWVLPAWTSSAGGKVWQLFRNFQLFRKFGQLQDIAWDSSKPPQYQLVRTYPWYLLRCWILFGYLLIWSKSLQFQQSIQHYAFRWLAWQCFWALSLLLIFKTASRLQCYCQGTQFEWPIFYW